MRCENALKNEKEQEFHACGFDKMQMLGSGYCDLHFPNTIRTQSKSSISLVATNSTHRSMYDQMYYLFST